MKRHRQLEQRVADLDSRHPDADTPELRRAFWLAHSTMGMPEHIVARALELAERCAPLPTKWPPPELGATLDGAAPTT